jgi:hypothetical protein
VNRFIFKEYKFEPHNGMATFSYGFEDGFNFEERVFFEVMPGYNAAVLEKALFLSFVLTGVSYYKTFPSQEIILKTGVLDEWQSKFFTKVFQEGLGQFAFENKLTRNDLATFHASTEKSPGGLQYTGSGILSLQSGGKDSLLTASMLNRRNNIFTPWYLSSGDTYPRLLDDLSSDKLLVSKRSIDIENLNKALEEGAANGHVPVTYIVQSFALIQAILLNKDTVLVSVAHEGEEPHEFIGDLPVNHQWSKTWEAEQMFSDYVKRYVSSDIKIGSPLRGYSELRVAELFHEYAWSDYGHLFSSCNVANYTQGKSNQELKWCGNCPKCANAFILFAPFIDADDLKSLFGGQDLFERPSLQETFKGLLGIDGVMKPFECVGEIDELRFAYHKAQDRGLFKKLSFDVPRARFDYMERYDSQPALRELVA